ncbi:MAG TPA: sulfatase-like hydrolase/transferase, partial [Chloroflexota bacterium]|nr:sulfatase-like hydrolase/transferase [Chloroflexota bacterium]
MSRRQPNILLFITDQQRWDTLGYTGRTACRTPNLDRLAREGVAFDRCITPDPICSPARAALFTGRYPHATGVGHNREIPLERPTLPEAFRDTGYHVAYSGKWHLGRGRGAAALDGWLGERGQGYKQWMAEHGFLDTYPYGTDAFRYTTPSARGIPAGESPTGSTAGSTAQLGMQSVSSPRTAPQEGLTEWLHESWVVNRTLEYLETRPKDQPFFHVCSVIGPHPIFVIPEPYYSLYDPARVPEPANFADLMEDKPAFQSRSIWHQAAKAHGSDWDAWRKSMAVYWGFVTMIDELLGRVLLRLESLGLADDTIVVFTSDHGEQMGSHGLFQKSCMYEESLRVPLIVRAPKMAAGGRRIDAPVSLADLAPTLMALTGISESGEALLETQGRHLSGWLTDARSIPPENSGASDDPASGAVFSEYKPYGSAEQMTDIRCIVGPRYKYAWNRDDRDELYDTWCDPAELHNRVDDP